MKKTSERNDNNGMNYNLSWAHHSVDPAELSNLIQSFEEEASDGENGKQSTRALVAVLKGLKDLTVELVDATIERTALKGWNGLTEEIRNPTNQELHVCNIYDDSIGCEAWSRKHLRVDHEAINERELSGDIFSMFLVCKNKSRVMIFCLLIILFQFGVTLVIFTDMRANFNIPVGLRSDVIVAQVLAITLMVATQDDLIHGLSCMFDGYTSKINAIAPHATLWRFYLVYGLQTTVGVLYLITLCTLIIQSDNVVNMFLSFTALSFVSSIDNAFFNYANNFLIEDEFGVLARQIQKIRIPIPKKIPSQESPISGYRAISFSYLLSIAYVLFAYVCIKQIEGEISCQSLVVQFGDEINVDSGVFSGAYDRIQKIGLPRYKINGRFVYVRRQNATLKAMFAYCDELQTWTFTPFEPEKFLETDPCKSFIFKSQKDSGFDIMLTSETGWVTTENSIMDFFSIRCNRCEDCKGNCINNQCLCDTGTYGLNCEFSSEFLCKSLYPAYPNGTEDTYPFFISESAILSSSSNSNRPIFVRNSTMTVNRSFEIIGFSGRRWLYFHSDFKSETDKTEFKSVEEYAHYVLISKNYPLYKSEPVTYGSHHDTGTPHRLEWFEDSFTYKNTVPFKQLICPDCNEKFNPCLNYGLCEKNNNETSRRCKCQSKYQGYICEEYRSES